MNQIDETNWQALCPEEIVEILKQLSIPWWIAGGWAIDLFIGKQTREHSDIDVLILRKDQFIIKDFLSDWLLYKTNQPGLLIWQNKEFLDIGINSIWCKKEEQSPWLMQIMFMESEEEEWFYRREPKIRGLLNQLGKISKDNIPYLAPEIQLLFKAKRYFEEKNEQDFQNILLLLSEQQKKWLIKSLKIEFPVGHKWIEKLKH